MLLIKKLPPFWFRGVFIDSTYDANFFIRYFEILADDECPDDACKHNGRTIRLQGELTDFLNTARVGMP